MPHHEDTDDAMLVSLFREEAHGYHPDAPRLAAGGSARGTRRHRRAVAARAAVATGLVLAVATGVASLTPASGGGAGPAAATAGPASGPVSGPASAEPAGELTGEAMTAAIARYLNGWRVVDSEVSDMTPGTALYMGYPRVGAWTAADDGAGVGSVTVTVAQNPPALGMWTYLASCAPTAEECTQTVLPDGSTLTTRTERADGTGATSSAAERTVLRTAMLVTPTGRHVIVVAAGARTQKEERATRAAPPLDVARLKALTDDPVFRRPLPAAEGGTKG
ncbi:hypothetical protein KNE206_69670 [Kitasatospora sp. NE20-6]|uniref:hypothetical protein n=1 Tax=Kitasatospora sp. NE20-6 TaxID=2859066 RepID=UPI0034DC2634